MMEIDGRSKVLHNWPMLIKEVRLKNLQCLFRQRDILQKDFAALVATSPPVFNQYMTGHRQIGDRMARKVEQHLKLPLGWMDQRNSEDWDLANSDYFVRRQPKTRAGSALAASIDSLSDESAIHQVTTLVEYLLKRQAQENGLRDPPTDWKPPRKPD